MSEINLDRILQTQRPRLTADDLNELQPIPPVELREMYRHSDTYFGVPAGDKRAKPPMPAWAAPGAPIPRRAGFKPINIDEREDR